MSGSHSSGSFRHVSYRWDETVAAKMDPVAALIYRSNQLGSDQRITNTGGGNTSAKIREKDPLTGESLEVLWVKGSGGDLRTATKANFASLVLGRVMALEGVWQKAEKRGPKTEVEDWMVGAYPHCTFNLNPCAPSIDTPLHAFVPAAHVDHTHPNAVIAVAASRNGKSLTKEIWGSDMGWVDWQRPGFDLGLQIREEIKRNPGIKGIVMGQHGLINWGSTGLECYENSLDLIERAARYIESKDRGEKTFGGAKYAGMEGAKRDAVLVELLPWLRGKVSGKNRFYGTVEHRAEILRFVNSVDAPRLAELGTSCPDHFLRTKIRPLVVDFDPAKPDVEATLAGLPAAVEAYREDYRGYYERSKHPDSPALRDPNAVVYLVPGVGMITFAKDKATARISGEFYVNAINVMRGASAVSEYRGLPEQEAFDIEYWLLEEAKLQRMPKPKSLAGRIALITGGAGGIGAATAERFLREGACVVLADIDPKALKEVGDGFAARHGKDVVRTVEMNVTDEAAVARAYAETAVELGGVDIVVSNAGIASSAPIEETTLALWDKNMAILSTGYFLVSREAFRMLRVQGIGGALVFVASKNGLAASPNASAYCTAKASEIHLARCLALEGAEAGIRVNVVNPDAVLRGSRIWQGEWLDQRAGTYKTDKEGLEEMYRQRSMLKRSVFPEDIAEAAYFLASDASAKSTGNILNVDAGHLASFTR